MSSLASGVLLSLIGMLAVGYASRVAVSQYKYYVLKYGELSSSAIDTKLQIADRAHGKYQWNYYLCQFMASESWSSYISNRSNSETNMLAAANDWCARGRELNPYDRSLAWVAVNLAGVESPEKAVVVWHDYVDRVFWDPWNLASLIRLKARAGQVDQANALLLLIKGRPEYQGAAAALRTVSRSVE